MSLRALATKRQLLQPSRHLSLLVRISLDERFNTETCAARDRDAARLFANLYMACHIEWSN